jgi:hypothetical protein
LPCNAPPEWLVWRNPLICQKIAAACAKGCCASKGKKLNWHFVPHCSHPSRVKCCDLNRRPLCGLRLQYPECEANGICGWLLHCKRFLSMFAVIFVSTFVSPACLCFGIASNGPDDFRKRGSNRLIDLRGPLPFPECPCSWLT